MKGILFLTWKYIKYYRLKTSIMAICLSLTIFAPIIVYITINDYHDRLYTRAQTVPLIIGTKGNHYDLLLRSLYFNGSYPGSINMETYNELKNKNIGKVIPLYLEFTAHKFYDYHNTNAQYDNVPIVGTYIDYFHLQQIKPSQGRFPIMLGEVVVGATIAKKTNIHIGDFILSDQKNMYDLSSSYPLKMKVVGILQQTYTPDDDVFFVDVKTTWIIKGILHGHNEVQQQDTTKVNIVIPQGTSIEYPEITIDNAHLFHAHADNKELPITSILIVPKDHKNKTILLGDYTNSENLQIIISEDVVKKLMTTIFRIQSFLQAYFVIVAIIVALFMLLVILLSIRIRKDEFATLYRIGCSKNIVIAMPAFEIVIITLISFVTSGIFTILFFYYLSPIQILHFFIS